MSYSSRSNFLHGSATNLRVGYLQPAPINETAKKWTRLIVACSVITIGISIVFAPELRSQSGTQRNRPVPEYLLKAGMFRNLAIVHKKASQLNPTAGNAMRNAVCRKIVLNAQDCTIAFASAASVAAQLDLLDQKAQRIIEDIRADHKNRPRGTLVPPPPQELRELQSQKKALIEGAMTITLQQLTPTGANALKAFSTKSSDRVTSNQ
jgi:hypothetical protein